MYIVEELKLVLVGYDSCELLGYVYEALGSTLKLCIALYVNGCGEYVL